MSTGHVGLAAAAAAALDLASLGKYLPPSITTSVLGRAQFCFLWPTLTKSTFILT